MTADFGQNSIPFAVVHESFDVCLYSLGVGLCASIDGIQLSVFCLF